MGVPGGHASRFLFLKKARTQDSVGAALERQHAPPYIGQEFRKDGVVILGQFQLRIAFAGPEHLLGMRYRYRQLRGRGSGDLALLQAAGSGPEHVARPFVVAQAEKYRLPELPVRGPFLERDLSEQLWCEKDQALLPRRISQRGLRSHQRSEPSVERREPAGLVLAANDEFLLPRWTFTFRPLGGAPLHVRSGSLFRDHPS